MNVAIIGCGYVAEFYGRDFSRHPELKLVGAFDRDSANLQVFVDRWRCKAFRSIEEICGDPGIDLVLNLTNPREHFAINRLCLQAGKHVYSEKPLAMTARDATALVDLAEERGLLLSSAPCSVLSVTAQTLWHALRSDAIGTVRLVYANFDDGMIAPRLKPWTWTNESRVPWPAKDEFEVGCTYEHAGYLLTWLGAFFGPAQRVTAFASCQIPDKGIPVDRMAPDFTVGCIEYGAGVVARVTCGLVAPRDKSLTIVGDRGVLFVGNVRDDSAPVFAGDRLTWLQTWLSSHATAIDRFVGSRLAWPGIHTLFRRRYVAPNAPAQEKQHRSKPVDFMRGPAEMMSAVAERRACRLSGRFGAHIVEIVEHLQYPERFGADITLQTSFPPIAPMEWTR